MPVSYAYIQYRPEHFHTVNKNIKITKGTPHTGRSESDLDCFSRVTTRKTERDEASYLHCLLKKKLQNQEGGKTR